MITAKSKVILNGLLLALMAAILSSCVAGVAYGPSVVVGSISLNPGATGQVTIRIFGLNDLQSFQVGPNGRFTFDPEVIHVKAIEGINGFQVFASWIDNANGEALFLAGYPGGSKSEDGIVQIEIEAIGNLGTSSTLTITAIDVLADSSGNDITDYGIFDGMATIGVYRPGP